MIRERRQSVQSLFRRLENDEDRSAPLCCVQSPSNVEAVQRSGGGEWGVVNRDVKITNNNCQVGATTGARQHLLFLQRSRCLGDT